MQIKPGSFMPHASRHSAAMCQRILRFTRPISSGVTEKTPVHRWTPVYNGPQVSGVIADTPCSFYPDAWASPVFVKVSHILLPFIMDISFRRYCKPIFLYPV